MRNLKKRHSIKFNIYQAVLANGWINARRSQPPITISDKRSLAFSRSIKPRNYLQLMKEVFHKRLTSSTSHRSSSASI